MAVQSEDLYLRFNHGIQMVFEGMWLNEVLHETIAEKVSQGCSWYDIYLEIEKNMTI